MKLDIVRAWKDESYRQSLSREQLSSLPVSPVRELELTGTELQSVNGGSLGLGASLGAFSGFFSEHEDVDSFAVNCDLNVFSNTFQDSINIISQTDVHCRNRSNNEREHEKERH